MQMPCEKRSKFLVPALVISTIDFLLKCVCVCVCVCVCACCVCVCAKQKQRERERERETLEVREGILWFILFCLCICDFPLWQIIPPNIYLEISWFLIFNFIFLSEFSHLLLINCIKYVDTKILTCDIEHLAYYNK
jgi:hypothetical protein